MEKYLFDWTEVKINICRPECFRVTEEIDEKSCELWNGLENGKYAVFLLNKKGRDHFSVIREIDLNFRSRFNYIGIKDANAITTQLIYTNSSSFSSIPQSYEAKDGSFIMKFVGFANEKLSHTGNFFSIIIELESSDEVQRIKQRIAEVSKEGYLPNFIGYQRFGTRRPVSHVIGKFLLKREWDKAFKWIIGFPFLTENEKIRKVRSAYHSNGNYKAREYYDAFPSSSFYERNLLKNYIATGSYYEALKRSSLPLDIYIDAFQAYIFNRYLSRVMNEIKDKEYVIKMPIYFSGCDDLCKELYEEEGIDRGMLTSVFKAKVRELRRKAFMKVRSMSFTEDRNRLTINFSLPRGSYATVVLRELSHANPLTFT